MRFLRPRVSSLTLSEPRPSLRCAPFQACHPPLGLVAQCMHWRASRQWHPCDGPFARWLCVPCCRCVTGVNVRRRRPTWIAGVLLVVTHPTALRSSVPPAACGFAGALLPVQNLVHFALGSITPGLNCFLPFVSGAVLHLAAFVQSLEDQQVVRNPRESANGELILM